MLRSWRSEQGKTIYTSIHISKKCQLLYIAKQSLPRLVSVFIIFFFSCAFMRKVLADFSFKLLSLLYVIRFFDPLECNLYYLVKRKRAEHTLKYFKMSTSYFCNNWCDVPWPTYVSPNFAWSCGMSRLVFN